MERFILNVIHRPEMVPEYAEKVTGHGKEENISRKALLTESLDIFKTQQAIAHKNGIKTTIQMTYASLFNAEAVALAKEHHEQYGDEIALSLLHALFFDIAHIFDQHQPVCPKPQTRKDELFELFIRTVGEHYKQQRSVAFYADKLCLTPKHLSNVIKELTGKSASQWIDDYVVLEAKTLLKSTNLTILQISEELHFANQSFFGKYFKQHTGLSPMRYRRS